MKLATADGHDAIHQMFLLAEICYTLFRSNSYSSLHLEVLLGRPPVWELGIIVRATAVALVYPLTHADAAHHLQSGDGVRISPLSFGLGLVRQAEEAAVC